MPVISSEQLNPIVFGTSSMDASGEDEDDNENEDEERTVRAKGSIQFSARVDKN